MGHRSRGNALSRSICAARGAISFSAKVRALSRIIEALSPRSKSKGRGVLGIMVETPEGKFRKRPCALSAMLSSLSPQPWTGGVVGGRLRVRIETFQRDAARLAIHPLPRSCAGSEPSVGLATRLHIYRYDMRNDLIAIDGGGKVRAGLRPGIVRQSETSRRTQGRRLETAAARESVTLRPAILARRKVKPVRW